MSRKKCLGGGVTDTMRIPAVMAKTKTHQIVLCLSLAAMILASGCGKKAKPHVAIVPRIGATESGVASWYGYPYHGRRAADGEIYDMERMTAAHRTLPFDTWVSVRNLSNDKSVTVRITDRGPFIDGRIIDLSHAAAQAIELIGPGVAQVLLTIVSPPPARELPALALFAVQIGAYRDRDRAEQMRADFEQRFGSAKILYRPGNPAVWRVLVGRESSIESANELLARILEHTQPAFVVRIDDSPSTPGQ